MSAHCHTEPTRDVVAYSAGTARPRARIPDGACDCHIHVYDARFPSARNATLCPPDASVAQYRGLQRRLGISRAILVTPSTYGSDNRCMLAALAQMGDSARGVAVIDGSESDQALQKLHDAGVRGIRLNLSLGVAGTIDDLEPLARRVAELGWHVQLLMSPDQLAAIAGLLRKLPNQIVFDHMGRLRPHDACRHPAHRLMLQLLCEERAWVKLSGGYLLSDTGDVNDPNLDSLAVSFIDAALERVIWGSDWPHATASAGRQPMPDDAHQIDRLAGWAGDARMLERILVINPAMLYGFDDKHDYIFLKET
ncbi:amidohydrolase family protein [Pusillimonas sp. SM2304]|uniref:amidohydrolase family protein n=1 Tax=Pusillimonas sp. SM2304 TaxID=3073241 RepID=UPI002875D9DB|nr:amidohydrolase family protein [Pusillimonas sp. SM2304]MDS1139430.1 amidohydrolase family protein [Pusillimonas sp. SM2304]